LNPKTKNHHNCRPMLSGRVGRIKKSSCLKNKKS
jgi:hypothetical protein